MWMFDKYSSWKCSRTSCAPIIRISLVTYYPANQSNTHNLSRRCTFRSICIRSVPEFDSNARSLCLYIILLPTNYCNHSAECALIFGVHTHTMHTHYCCCSESLDWKINILYKCAHRKRTHSNRLQTGIATHLGDVFRTNAHKRRHAPHSLSIFSVRIFGGGFFGMDASTVVNFHACDGIIVIPNMYVRVYIIHCTWYGASITECRWLFKAARIPVARWFV